MRECFWICTEAKHNSHYNETAISGTENNLRTSNSFKMYEKKQQNREFEPNELIAKSISRRNVTETLTSQN